MDYNITFRKKDKSLQCILSYKDSTGTWKQKTKQGFKTQKEAKPWVNETVKKLSQTVEYINPDMSGTTVDELYKVYLAHVELYRESNTVINIETAYKHFEDIKNDKVTAVNILKIQECIDTMVKKGLNPSTINNYITKLSVMFNYAVTPLKIIKNNPFDRIKPLTTNKENKKIKALTKAQSDDLLSKLKNIKYYLISLIACTCGLRIGEIIGLTWADIDEKGLMINVNKQWKIIKKPRTYGYGPTKSKNSNRDVPVPATTMAEIIKYKNEYPIDISGRLFPYANTCATAGNLAERYKSIGYDISVHDLRHTYASRLVANGVDFKTVAELIGDTVDMVIKTYSHFTPDMMESAKKAVNNIF